MIPGVLAGAMGSGATPSGDQYWANVLSLLHFEGVDASTTFTDQVGTTTWTRVADAQIDTAQFRFGSASGLFPNTGGGNGRITSNTDANFAFGTGDFTIEGFFRGGGKTGARILFDSRPTGTNGAYVTIYFEDNNLYYYRSAAARITIVSTLMSSNTWFHWALARQSGTMRLFLDGTKGTDFADSTNLLGTRYRYGNTSAGDSTNNIVSGHMDECRITKGVARYTDNFTPPSSPFPNFGP